MDIYRLEFSSELRYDQWADGFGNPTIHELSVSDDAVDWKNF
jgi:hypothetical protein